MYQGYAEGTINNGTKGLYLSEMEKGAENESSVQQPANGAHQASVKIANDATMSKPRRGERTGEKQK